MSAKPTHRLAIKTGEYIDHNNQTKGRWLQIGTVFRHDDGGTSIKLDCIPVGLKDWDGWVSVFKREDPQQQPTTPPPARQPASTGQLRAPPPPEFQGPDEDIPF